MKKTIILLLILLNINAVSYSVFNGAGNTNTQSLTYNTSNSISYSNAGSEATVGSNMNVDNELMTGQFKVSYDSTLSDRIKYFYYSNFLYNTLGNVEGRYDNAVGLRYMVYNNGLYGLYGSVAPILTIQDGISVPSYSFRIKNSIEYWKIGMELSYWYIANELSTIHQIDCNISYKLSSISSIGLNSSIFYGSGYFIGLGYNVKMTHE